MNKHQRAAKKAAKKNKRRAEYKAQKTRKHLAKAHVRSQAMSIFRFERKEQAQKNAERERERIKLKSENWDEVEPYHFIRRLSTGEFQRKKI